MVPFYFSHIINVPAHLFIFVMVALTSFEKNESNAIRLCSHFRPRIIELIFCSSASWKWVGGRLVQKYITYIRSILVCQDPQMG